MLSGAGASTARTDRRHELRDRGASTGVTLSLDLAQQAYRAQLRASLEPLAKVTHVRVDEAWARRPGPIAGRGHRTFEVPAYGLAVQAALNQRGIKMPVIVLTGHGDVPVAVEAMKSGAIEVLEKPYEKQTLVTAITSAFEQLDADSAGDRRSKDAQARLSALTPREKEVLECLVAGLTNKGIAQALSISPRTVEIHRAHMMEKLEADSLSAALRLAFVAGLGAE